MKDDECYLPHTLIFINSRHKQTRKEVIRELKGVIGVIENCPFEDFMLKLSVNWYSDKAERRKKSGDE